MCYQTKHFGVKCCEVTENIIVDYEAGELWRNQTDDKFMKYSDIYSNITKSHMHTLYLH